jgi:hypothetical protein
MSFNLATLSTHITFAITSVVIYVLIGISRKIAYFAIDGTCVWVNMAIRLTVFATNLTNFITDKIIGMIFFSNSYLQAVIANCSTVSTINMRRKSFLATPITATIAIPVIAMSCYVNSEATNIAVLVKATSILVGNHLTNKLA